MALSAPHGSGVGVQPLVSDVATSSIWADEVRISFQGADGRLSEAAVLADPSVLRSPSHLTSADINGDGKPDLVFVSHSNRLVWLRNLGAGAFDAPEVIASVSLASDLAVIAVDGDVDLDLVVALGSGGLGWLENLGGGGFGALETISATSAYRVQGADFDADGDTDLVASAKYYRSFGDGSFWPPSDVPGVGTSWFIVGDLDGDDDLDIFSHDGSFVSNDGSGVFTVSATDGFGSSFGSNLGAIADIDGVAPPDWVGLRSTSPFEAIQWRPLTPNGADEDAFHPISLEPTNRVSHFSTDLDGDDDDDVIVLIGGTQQFAGIEEPFRLVWRRNDGTGVFGPAEEISDHAGITLEIVDIDSDGDRDLITTPATVGTEYRVILFLNDGAGHFTESVLYSTPTSTAPVTLIASGDIDGDGDLDLVHHVDWPSQAIYLTVNQGGGVFSPSQRLFTQSRVSGIAVGDVNNDDLDDLVLGIRGDFLSKRPEVRLFENAAGVIPSTFEQVWEGAIPFGFMDVMVEDLDGDGLGDILQVDTFHLSDETARHLILWGQLLGGGFQELPVASISDPDSGFVQVQVADIDADGLRDVVVNETDGATGRQHAVAYRQISAGQFLPESQLLPNITKWFSVGDLDGDGDLDLISRRFGQGGSSLNWYENLSAEQTPESAFNLWAAESRLAGDSALPLAIAPFGGFANLLYYAFGVDPVGGPDVFERDLGIFGFKSTSEGGATGVSFQFLIARADDGTTGRPGLIYRIQTGQDAESWDTVGTKLGFGDWEAFGTTEITATSIATSGAPIVQVRVNQPDTDSSSEPNSLVRLLVEFEAGD